MLFVGYAWKATVYTDNFALVLKVIDLSFITIVSLLMIVIFGVGDEMPTDGYLTLGYVVVGFGILLVVNSFVRAFYFVYRKVSELLLGMKD